MRFRNALIVSCALAAIAVGGDAFAFGQLRYLCPAVPFGAGEAQENDRCVCTTTNWSKFAIEVTTELFRENGDPYNSTPVTELVQPNATEVVIRQKPEGDRACSCMVTTDFGKARVSISARRNFSTRLSTTNCDLRGF